MSGTPFREKPRFPVFAGADSAISVREPSIRSLMSIVHLVIRNMLSRKCRTLLSISGIMLGATGAATATYFLRDEGFEAVITAGAVILATLFSAAVGLFFGIYPAQRAAALNPIDALIYE